MNPAALTSAGAITGTTQKYLHKKLGLESFSDSFLP